jgi:exodeoxyribonuclease V gamma subunit
LAKDTYNILFRTDDFVNAIDDSLCIPPSQNTLLEKIQYDIYHNLNKKRTSITLNDLQDESLIISSSYTPMREVEALYNQILHFLDKDTDLQAQDIIVQLSDIDLYTPYIKAVFDNAPHRLPYTIADRSYAGGDTMIGILEMLLKLGAEDFTSEKILQLLNTEFIKNRFGITNLDLIRNVVREANIRFGIKGYAKDDTRYVSWRYGLERILLGYAIKGGEEYELEEYSTYPLDVIEGSDAEELLRFKAFVDQLILMIDKRTLDRPLSEWKRYVEELIGNLLSIDEKSEAEYKYIQKHLLSIENMNDWLEDAIAYDVFQKSFTDALFSNSRAGHFMSGGITFCSMIPMRSIPFKFTAMLGMDADKFPRTETKIAFNLIDVEYKRGDRNTKNNDKYLFLESLLSARKYLYLSYIGNSTKDNSSFNPSLLIDELKTYIELACEKLPTGKQIDDFLVQKHPLHAFSQKYFDKTSSLFTYFSDDFNTKKSEIENTFPEKTTPSENADKIHLNLYELIRFFEDPYQYYYNNVLQIYYQGSSTLLPESEIFELDSLQNYQIQSDLFQSDLEIDKYIDKAKKTGILPLANMANLATKNAYEEIKLIKNQYLKITKNTSPQSIAIDTKLEKVILESFIQPIHNKNYVYSNISSDYSKAKHLLKAWFVHLVLMANKQNIDTIFIAKYYNKPIVFKQDILSAKEARERLNQLSNIYLRGQQKPAAFIPKIAFDFVSNYVKNKADKEKIEQNLQNAFNELHKLDTPNFVGIYNPYIEKESEAGYFADNKYVKDSLKEASLLVYADIIHLV